MENPYAQAADAYIGKPLSSIGAVLGAPKESGLSLAVNESVAVGKLLAEIRSEVADLSFRLTGPDVPPDTCSPDRESFGDGIVGGVRNALSDARVTANETISMLNRLRAIV